MDKKRVARVEFKIQFDIPVSVKETSLEHNGFEVMDRTMNWVKPKIAKAIKASAIRGEYRFIGESCALINL